MKKLLIFTGLFLLTSSLVLVAQEGAAQESSNLFQLYLKGGIIGFFLTFMSMISMTLTILYILQMKRDKLIPNFVISEIEGAIEEDDIDGALEVCESEDVPLAKIMASALTRFEGGNEKMVDAMVESSEEQANLLATKIGWLSLIGGLAPMVGLFGTVSGMISAFDTIAKSNGTATPDQLAKGIMEALVTTFLGLLVAIPTIAAYHFLRNQVNAIIIETNNIASELVDKATQQ